VCAGILAGGRGSRAGGIDKGWMPWQGSTLIEHAVRRLTGRVDAMLISANRNLERYAALGVPVVADARRDFCGPLAGIAALLAACPCPLLFTAPVDSPEFPLDVVARLYAALEPRAAAAAVVHDAERRQPLFAMYRRELARSAADAVAAGDGAVWAWQDSIAAATVDVADLTGSFANLNRILPA
jgi:molybdopterin-guanine dinucleotide biosynthesis protein A